MHNEAIFNRGPLFSVPPDWIALLSWIIFSSYLFLCGGGNIDDKMAPSYPVACASDSHLLTGPSLPAAAWLPGEPEVGINSPLPSPSPSSRLSAEFCCFFFFKERERNKATGQTFITQWVTAGREQLNFPVSRGSSRLAVERPAFDL